jgi:hypothetical protein
VDTFELQGRSIRQAAANVSLRKGLPRHEMRRRDVPLEMSILWLAQMLRIRFAPK